MSASASLRWHTCTGPSCPDPGSLAHITFDAQSDHLFDCPLAFLDGDFRAESWDIGDSVTAGAAHGWQYRRHPRLALAALHIEDDPNDPAAIQVAGRTAYEQLFALQGALGLPYPQRIWHWLSAATRGADDDQRYRRFCLGRAQALEANPSPWPALPPATLVEGARPGLRMHVLLGDRPVTPVENPRQVSAYHYPRDYGIRAPAFARAGVAWLGDSRYLLISGTASIVGHASRHLGHIQAQADEALANIAAVIDAAAPIIGKRSPTQLECIKAYLRHPGDASAVAERLQAQVPDVPAALLHAPLCRDDLLVEFEAQMRLDREPGGD